MRVVAWSIRVLVCCLPLLISPVANAQTIQVLLRDGGIQPAQIQARQNQPLHLFVRNQGAKVHNLVIPDFYVFTQNLKAGETVDVRFTPSKTGNYRYYSDKNGVPEAGMRGQLQVR